MRKGKEGEKKKEKQTKIRIQVTMQRYGQKMKSMLLSRIRRERDNPQLSENVELCRSILTAGQEKRSLARIRSKSLPPPDIPSNPIPFNAIQFNGPFHLTFTRIQRAYYIYLSLRASKCGGNEF